MKKKNMIFISLATAAILISGCGGGGGATEDTGSGTTVTVERGPVFNATVRDASGQTAANTPSNSNFYVFASTPTYPITASGGQIDVNYDGVIDTNDFPLTVTLKTDKGLNITAMTTYLSDLNDTQRDALANSLGVSVDDLYTLPSESNGLLVAAINAAFSAIYTLNYDASTNIEEKFNDTFSYLKQEEIASDNETSDNITDDELTDMEELVNSDLGISHLTEADLDDGNDNVTDDNSDNVTDDGNDDFDNVTNDDGDDFDNVTNSDDYDNTTGDAG